MHYEFRIDWRDVSVKSNFKKYVSNILIYYVRSSKWLKLEIDSVNFELIEDLSEFFKSNFEKIRTDVFVSKMTILPLSNSNLGR